jgi:hypothetical protein
MSNNNPLSFTPPSGPHRGARVELEIDVPWATGRTDKVTIYDRINP